ncbi:MAG: ribonuclease catalytic domain-containing protein [Pseudomonadota bacterium]
MAGLDVDSVIWVERDGCLEPRRVLSSAGSILEVQGPGGDEERLSVKRVVFPSAVKKGQVRSLADLRQFNDQVSEALARVDLEETWELLVDEGMAEISPVELADFAFGDGGGVSSDAVRVVLEGGTPWFKRLKTGAIKIQPRAVVEERVRQEARTAARQRELDDIADTLRGALSGDGPAGTLSQEIEAELDLFQRVAATGDVPARAERILEAIYPDSRRSVPELAFQLMVDLGRWNEHQDLNLLALGIPRPFCAAALAEVQALLDGPPPTRRGTRALPADLYTVAIDDAATREVDDALGIEDLGEGVLLHVIIADVAAWIRAGTALDLEARERAATAYHPVENHPMLPKDLSYGPMSLAAGEPRLAVDLQLHCGPDGHLVSMDVVPVEVTLDRRVTYEEADEILGAPREDGILSRTLRRLHDLATGLQALRVEAGAAIFKRQEFRIQVDGDGRVDMRKLPLDSPSQVLVSECMIAACAGAGRLVDEHGAAGVFRVQPPPDVEIRHDPDRAGDPLWLHENIRKLRRVEFSLSPGPHAALGVSAYTQVTSPIRRYADLVMQRQIAALVSTGVPALSGEDLGEVVAHLETTGLALLRAQNAAVRYWTLVALGEHLGEPTEAIVLEEQGRGLMIELLDWGLRTRLHPSVPHHPGDRITVRVVQADPRGDHIVVRDAPAEEDA